MKQGNPALKEAVLLYKVAEAFMEAGENAERIAYGGKAVCDLSAGGRLARLAKQAAKCAKPSPDCPPDYPDPLAELSRAVEALPEIAALHGRAGEWEFGSAFGRLVQEEFEWCHERGLRSDGGPDCVWRDDKGPEHLRRTIAARLATDCKVCGNVAQQKADDLLWIALLRSGYEEQVAEAKAREEDAKAEMYKAQGKAEAEAKARERADEERKKAEAKRLENELALARWQERNAPMRRGRYEVTQKEVAKQLGVSVPTVKAWERDRGTPPAGYTREKRRTKAGFAAFVAGLRRDLSTEENMMEAAGTLRLGNRQGMGVKKGTK